MAYDPKKASEEIAEVVAAIQECARTIGRRPLAADYKLFQLANPQTPTLLIVRKWLGSWNSALAFVFEGMSPTHFVAGGTSPEIW